MISVQNLLQLLNGNNRNSIHMSIKQFLFSLLFFITLSVVAQVEPNSFKNHKVKKKETLYGLARKYDIQIEQIYQYNPLIKKIGLKKSMILQIPVYSKPKPSYLFSYWY